MSPLRYIDRAQLTVFFCVPSLAAAVATSLTPGLLPDLRISLFCGEPLPDSLAKLWSEAACNSKVYNLYGPTETTIAVSLMQWDPHCTDFRYSSTGTVNIGNPFANHRWAVVDANGRMCRTGAEGELLIAGPQVCSGYIHAAGNSERTFVEIPEFGSIRWYCTGDVVRPVGQALEFCGRMDDQVKIFGYRVELGEIEFHVRKLLGIETAIALALSLTSGVTSIVLCIPSSVAWTEKAIVQELRKILPYYAVPSAVQKIDDFPRNFNGKLDRRYVKHLVMGKMRRPS